jgi:hypothetical protein
MGGTALSLEESVARSPRKYASTFQSRTERFRDRGSEKMSLNLQYNITSQYSVQFRKPAERPDRDDGNNLAVSHTQLHERECSG